MKTYLIIRFAFALLVLFSAHALSSNGYNEMDSSIGRPGDPNNISRTIKITVVENRFLPSEIEVQQGETIKFLLISGGNEKHEMIIDTMDNLKKQAKLRRNNPEIKSTGPNQIQLDPGERKELIWEFTEVGSINFACPLPGHFKGMRGIIYVEKK